MLAAEIAAYEAESTFITDLANTMDAAGLLTEVGSAQLEAQRRTVEELRQDMQDSYNEETRIPNRRSRSRTSGA
jgi:hypothetical protein